MGGALAGSGAHVARGGGAEMKQRRPVDYVEACKLARIVGEGRAAAQAQARMAMIWSLHWKRHFADRDGAPKKASAIFN